MEASKTAHSVVEGNYPSTTTPKTQLFSVKYDPYSSLVKANSNDIPDSK